MYSTGLEKVIQSNGALSFKFAYEIIEERMIFCITIENVLEIYEEVIHSSIIEELQRQIQNVLPPNGNDAFSALLESEAL